jgi:hypothetical protein
VKGHRRVWPRAAPQSGLQTRLPSQCMKRRRVPAHQEPRRREGKHAGGPGGPHPIGGRGMSPVIAHNERGNEPFLTAPRHRRRNRWACSSQGWLFWQKKARRSRRAGVPGGRYPAKGPSGPTMRGVRSGSGNAQRRAGTIRRLTPMSDAARLLLTILAGRSVRHPGLVYRGPGAAGHP